MTKITWIVVISLGVLILLWSNWKDQKINEYWDSQLEICGKVGWYQVENECVPVDYLK